MIAARIQTPPDESALTSFDLLFKLVCCFQQSLQRWPDQTTDEGHANLMQSTGINPVQRSTGLNASGDGYEVADG